ncbi:hypothetical protein CALVIDRAFT_504361 [Calocera viscosa TUFC12733]|uniref:Uncharacterized protein n=1 Tax=Calocera viscosa (strain TUFC12733) TaxID=1330018 RepID=A0A167I5V7_CALVF|nr:hypothetical protein CALVIDRAFT_504361 [Calocera viscosa TUFC12733]
MSEIPERPEDLDKFVALVGEMKQSVASARAAIKPVLAQLKDNSLDFTPGISLLTLKSHTLLSYMHSLVLLSSHKLLGHSLQSRTPPPQAFSDPKRDARGTEAGDLIDDLIEGRVILEKIKLLEGKMKYQIDKLVKAGQAQQKGKPAADDPLSFKPNLANFTTAGSASGSEDEASDTEKPRSGIYQPPRVAPMPYTEAPRKGKRDRALPPPSALANLALDDGTNPFVESTSGLGSAPSMSSSRARELERMRRFEEENMTRLVMNKREAKRRTQDEAGMALGGVGRRVGGLEDEFADVLRGIGEVGRPGRKSDGYDELRKRGQKEGVLERSRKRPAMEEMGANEAIDGGKRKRTRFEKDLKSQRRKEKRTVK